MFARYSIWYRFHSGGDWSLTAHHVMARTDKEAESKLRRKFAGCDFSNMSLVAIPYGKVPK